MTRFFLKTTRINFFRKVIFDKNSLLKLCFNADKDFSDIDISRKFFVLAHVTWPKIVEKVAETLFFPKKILINFRKFDEELFVNEMLDCGKMCNILK